MNNSTSGTFRLKGHQLFSKGYSERRVRNIQELADTSGMTYATAHRWAKYSDGITGVDLRNLAGFLVDGLQLKPEEVENMRFGDIFEFVPNEKA